YVAGAGLESGRTHVWPPSLERMKKQVLVRSSVMAAATWSSLLGSTASAGARYRRPGLMSSLVALTGLVMRLGATDVAAMAAPPAPSVAAPCARTSRAAAHSASRRPERRVITFPPAGGDL